MREILRLHIIDYSIKMDFENIFFISKNHEPTVTKVAEAPTIGLGFVGLSRVGGFRLYRKSVRYRISVQLCVGGFLFGPITF